VTCGVNMTPLASTPNQLHFSFMHLVIKEEKNMADLLICEAGATLATLVQYCSHVHVDKTSKQFSLISSVLQKYSILLQNEVHCNAGGVFFFGRSLCKEEIRKHGRKLRTSFTVLPFLPSEPTRCVLPEE